MQAEKENDDKNLFTWRTDDSYERLCVGPPLTRPRPDNVPPLKFDGFPEYESSSDEEEQQQQQPLVEGNLKPTEYQESLKYIENFYNKYAIQQQAQQQMLIQADYRASQKKASVDFSEGGLYRVDGGSTPNQLSYQDSLSRDEEDDIREEIRLA